MTGMDSHYILGGWSLLE